MARSTACPPPVAGIPPIALIVALSVFGSCLLPLSSFSPTLKLLLSVSRTPTSSFTNLPSLDRGKGSLGVRRSFPNIGFRSEFACETGFGRARSLQKFPLRARKDWDDEGNPQDWGYTDADFSAFDVDKVPEDSWVEWGDEPPWQKALREAFKNHSKSENQINYLDAEALELHLDKILEPLTRAQESMKTEGPAVFNDLEENTRFEAKNQEGSVKYTVDGTLQPLAVEIKPELLKEPPTEISRQILDAYLTVWDEGTNKVDEMIEPLFRKWVDTTLPDGTFNG